jgi:hypothetical protein
MAQPHNLLPDLNCPTVEAVFQSAPSNPRSQPRQPLVFNCILMLTTRFLLQVAGLECV